MTPYTPTYPDLEGKVALVTGESGSIGAATCRMLAANGAKAAVNGRGGAKVEAVVEAIRASGEEAVSAPADYTDFAAIERVRKGTEEALDPFGVVAAFAVGGRARLGPVAVDTEEEWRSSVDGSLTATFLTLKAFMPGMVERGDGSIVAMGSSAARITTPVPAPYAAAKTGVVMLTRHVAGEVGSRGVRVYCLAPHTILAERMRGSMSEEQQRPRCRWGGSGPRRTWRWPSSSSPRKVRPGSPASRSTWRGQGDGLKEATGEAERSANIQKDVDERRGSAMGNQTRELNNLDEEWAAAELGGDTASLEKILADDFVGVGPRGFVLTKEQWISRHEAGNLNYRSFGLDEAEVRTYGEAAIVVCRQSAAGVHEDENGRYDIDESFRATLVFVRKNGDWRLAGLQLSPILGRP